MKWTCSVGARHLPRGKKRNEKVRRTERRDRMLTSNKIQAAFEGNEGYRVSSRTHSIARAEVVHLFRVGAFDPNVFNLHAAVHVEGFSFQQCSDLNTDKVFLIIKVYHRELLAERSYRGESRCCHHCEPILKIMHTRRTVILETPSSQSPHVLLYFTNKYGIIPALLRLAENSCLCSIAP